MRAAISCLLAPVLFWWIATAVRSSEPDDKTERIESRVNTNTTVKKSLGDALAKATAPATPSAVRRKSGLEARLPWTTSRIQGTPEPPPPYRTEVAFPKLKFNEPLALESVPGTNYLAVAERGGKVFAFLNDPATSQKILLHDVGKTVYGMAFHPRFLDNGLFYVTYILDAANPAPKGSRIAQFQIPRRAPVGRANPASEKIILEWPSGGHNGGCLQFGLDGYLYLATGDSSGIADELQTGQDLSDLSGAILRLDVDRPTEGRNYGIPADNPFLQYPGARPEIFSYGHRQVWRFSFDKATGRMWGGEVGQDLWEMIYIIHKGGNYGWSVMEGSHPFRPERKRGPTPFIPPIVEHNHNDFRSITGGYVSHSARVPELRGTYLYGDYDTGRVWMFGYDPSRPEGKRVLNHREAVDTQLRIVSFGQDEEGDVLLVDFVGGQLHRLVKAPPVTKPLADFPRKLSETGLFASTKDHRPAAGVIPYSVNSPLYSDNAEKERFIALPGLSQIEFETVLYPQGAPGARPGWRFPNGTVLVKTFSIDMERGNPNSRKRLETRILHFEQVGGTEEYGDQVWYGYTYVWNDEQTDATLLEAGGANRQLKIRDAAAPGGVREQTWRFPSRAECSLCHTMSAKYALGVNTLQMNRDHDYGGVVANQLETLDHLKVFTKPLPSPVSKLESLVDYQDERQPVDLRARAYLHANCSHCHRKWGGGNAEFQLLATLPVGEMGISNVPPAHSKFELKDPRLLVPRDPGRSILLNRMRRIGLGRMPHVGSNVVDKAGAELIERWIRELNEP